MIFIILLGVLINYREEFSINDRCYLTIKQERLFLPSKKCYSNWKKKIINGIYVVGLEESLLFINYKKNPSMHDIKKNNTWVDYYGKNLSGARTAKLGSGRVFYKVKAEIRYSDEKGLFGPRGGLSHGILIEKFIKVQKN